MKSPLWGAPRPLSHWERTIHGCPGAQEGAAPLSQQSVTPGYTFFHLQPLATPSLTSLLPLAIGTAWVPTGDHGAVACGGDHRWATQGHLGKPTWVTSGLKVGQEEAPEPLSRRPQHPRVLLRFLSGPRWPRCLGRAGQTPRARPLTLLGVRVWGL